MTYGDYLIVNRAIVMLILKTDILEYDSFTGDADICIPDVAYEIQSHPLLRQKDGGKNTSKYWSSRILARWVTGIALW